MEKKSASDNDINMKKGISMLHTTYEAPKRGFWGQIQRIKHKKEDFGVRYNVSSTKKRNLGLDTTYQALKRGIWGQIQRIKH